MHYITVYLKQVRPLPNEQFKKTSNSRQRQVVTILRSGLKSLVFQAVYNERQ